MWARALALGSPSGSCVRYRSEERVAEDKVGGWPLGLLRLVQKPRMGILLGLAFFGS